MKIVYLHQYFSFPYEPDGTRSYDLAKGFVREGYEVEIISSTSNDKYKNNKGWFVVEEDGLVVNYIYLPYNNKLSYFKRIIVFFKFVFLSTKKLLSINKDLVLATSTPLTIGIPAFINKRHKKTPYIFEVRDVWPEAPIAIGVINNQLLIKLLYWLERKIYNNADAIIPLSVDMKNSIISRYPKLKKKPVEVIENISEINRFQKIDNNEPSILTLNGIPPCCYYILYAGTFGNVNGLDYVISLAEKTIELAPNIKYILIGDGKEKKDIVENAKNKQVLNENVFILNPIAKKDLPKLYSEVTMGSSFVINIKELWANSANKFFDTLAAGKPILINHGGWQKDVIDNDNIGYTLPPVLDEQAILDFIKYIYDEELWHTQSKNALNKAISSYSLEIALEKYLLIIKQIGQYV